MINICFSDVTRMNLREAKYISGEKGLDIDFGNDFLMIVLQLDQGDISDNGTGVVRKQFLTENQKGYIFGEDYSDFECAYFGYSMRTIEKIKEYIANGEQFRIWYSNGNNEFCSLCWLLSLFDELDAENNIFVVKVPSEVIVSKGKYKKYHSTGSFSPEELLEYAFEQKTVSKSFKSYHIKQWKRAQAENTNLRVSINDNIVSVSEDFYDSAIMVEAQSFGEVINEAQLVVKCASRLNLTDLFVGKRIEHMVEKGIFKAVSQPAYSAPFYCKKIKRV